MWPASGRLLRSELRLIFGRRRNQLLLVFLAAVPVLVGAAVRWGGGPNHGEGPMFLPLVQLNGLYLTLACLVVVLPLLLPLAVGVVAGDTLAGEASAGTLRYLLLVPVARNRLLAVKAGGALIYAGAAVAALTAVGLVTGAALFPTGRLLLLPDASTSFAGGLGRDLLAAGYVWLSLSGLVLAGLAISTWTEVPIAAMAVTLLVAVVSQILDAVPQVQAIHPYLLTHHWLAFGELLRDRPRWAQLGRGLAVQAGYGTVAVAVAWARFRQQDVTS